MKGFISWFGEIREFVMVPSDGLEILHNCDELALHLYFCDGIGCPMFRIVLIFEHIDARMGDTRELSVELFDGFEYLSWERIGKSKDEIYVYRDGYMSIDYLVNVTQCLDN